MAMKSKFDFRSPDFITNDEFYMIRAMFSFFASLSADGCECQCPFNACLYCMICLEASLLRCHNGLRMFVLFLQVLIKTPGMYLGLEKYPR